MLRLFILLAFLTLYLYSLSIPGELVLARAQSERVYYPGKVLSFNEKSNKYKVLTIT